MEFLNFVNKHRPVLNKRMQEELLFEKKNLSLINPILAKIFEKFIKASKGGKQLRGILVLLGYAVAGGKDISKILDAAVACEIFQTAILAQDDVIDKSELRRGKKTLMVSLGNNHKALSYTIFLSDLGFFTAYKLISGLKIDENRKINALKFFTESLLQTAKGVLLDIEATEKGITLSEKEILQIALLKTAGYTITGPLSLGAILGGGDAKLLKKLQIFGDNLGTGFQIQDDISGVFDSSKTTGKSECEDIKERKATLLISSALRFGSKKDADRLRNIYSSGSIKESNINEVKEIFVRSKALEYSKEKAAEYFLKAENALSVRDDLLHQLTAFIRNK